MNVESISIRPPDPMYCRLWSRGDGSEQGAVIYLHGLGDHGGRIESFARRSVARGWAVIAPDFPGHGRSGGKRGMIPSYDDLLAGIADYRYHLRERFGDIPQMLVGHSMGGNLAVNYTLRQREFRAAGPLDALVLVAPMIMPPKKLDRTQILAAWGTGQMFRWWRIRKEASVEQLTRDEDVAERLKNDPLQHSQISLYLATQLLAQGRFALDRAREIDVPTMVMIGDNDQLVDRAACHHLALRIGDNGNLVRWPEGRHDLIHDVDAVNVTDTILQWTDRLQSADPTQGSDHLQETDQARQARQGDQVAAA